MYRLGRLVWARQFFLFVSCGLNEAHRMQRAYYNSTIEDFVSADSQAILGELVSQHRFATDLEQRNAWVLQIDHLKDALEGLKGHIFFEFTIPRMGKRADIVLLHDGLIFVIEYKVGADHFSQGAIDQVIDYALDLKNFHSGSHKRPVVPVLVATNAPNRSPCAAWSADSVAKPALANQTTLGAVIAAFTDADRQLIDPAEWVAAPYKPTPTIIEAARALYEGHSVEEISRSDAGVINLTRTNLAISQRIERAKANHEKHVIFVTGVPGSGKTLAGLNIATSRMRNHDDEHAVFLSGNGPLVTVLREALARDEVARARHAGKSLTKADAQRKASAFIQNIHHFRDDNLIVSEAPAERVVVFDEAQRAWNKRQTSRFMKQKRGQQDFDMSEPKFLLSVMDRHPDWCVVVCLIGGGQEINTGEAGLGEGFRALADNFPTWQVAYSGNLGGSEYTWDDLTTPLATISGVADGDLHLGVSVRSFRSETVSDFVSSIIDADRQRAKSHRNSLAEYPIFLTRSLANARQWLRDQARGTERTGLVASSNGLRLKPAGIYVKSKIDAANWFLDDANDVRSSDALEDAATEFDIQGLELDWVGVCWDANFRYSDSGWLHFKFSGSTWKVIRDELSRLYLANAYRVLLTRARQGMVIFVPCGDPQDVTRPPEFYDGTFRFLSECGIPVLDENI